MKRSALAVAVLAVLAACGGGSSGGGDGGTALKGLADCTAVSGEAVICGTAYAADGVTPLVGAEVTKGGASGSISKLKGLYKGVPSDTKCETDAAGAFACSGIDASGSYSFIITATGVTINFSATVTLDATTSIPAADTTATSSDSTAKWLVVMGSWDGVQLLLSQLKSCTLTGDAAYPASMTGSDECTTAGLTVIAYSDTAATFESVNNLTEYDAIFINCGTDMSAYAEVIQEYVAQGGHIYFSDLADPGVTAAFPEKVTFGVNDTSAGDITADIDYSGLVAFLGKSTMTVEFDLGVWRPVESVASGVTTYVSGDTSSLGGTADAPITVGWKEGSGGCVFYTSYHIEGASTGADQEKVLKYLIQNISAVCQ